MDVALLHQLMGTSNQLQTVDMAEIVGYLRSEHPSSTTGVDSPVLDILRVRPHQVAERTLMRDFDLTVDSPDLVDSFDFGRESSMHTEDLA